MKRFRGAGAVSENRVPEIQARIDGQIDRKLDDIVREAASVLDSRQKGHDTPKEYARVDAQCDDWDKRLNGQ